jgi:hypothetical protein
MDTSAAARSEEEGPPYTRWEKIGEPCTLGPYRPGPRSASLTVAVSHVHARLC